MQIASETRAHSTERPATLLLADDKRTPVPVLAIAAGLALAVAIIHLQDQGGLLGSQSPTYLRDGYYMVEIGSTLAAGLLVRGKIVGWVLGLAATIGPMTGYLLSRSVGIPGDPGDVGNWGYLLGAVSLVVEGTFIVIAAIALWRLTHRPSRQAAQAAHRTFSQPVSQQGRSQPRETRVGAA